MPPAIKLQCLPVAWLPGGLVELEVTGRAHIRLAATASSAKCCNPCSPVKLPTTSACAICSPPAVERVGSSQAASPARLLVGSLHDNALLLCRPLALEQFPSPLVLRTRTKSAVKGGGGGGASLQVLQCGCCCCCCAGRRAGWGHNLCAARFVSFHLSAAQCCTLQVVASVVHEQLVGVDIAVRTSVPAGAQLASPQQADRAACAGGASVNSELASAEGGLSLGAQSRLQGGTAAAAAGLQDSHPAVTSLNPAGPAAGQQPSAPAGAPGRWRDFVQGSAPPASGSDAGGRGADGGAEAPHRELQQITIQCAMKRGAAAASRPPANAAQQEQPGSPAPVAARKPSLSLPPPPSAARAGEPAPDPARGSTVQPPVGGIFAQYAMKPATSSTPRWGAGRGLQGAVTQAAGAPSVAPQAAVAPEAALGAGAPAAGKRQKVEAVAAAPAGAAAAAASTAATGRPLLQLPKLSWLTDKYACSRSSTAGPTVAMVTAPVRLQAAGAEPVAQPPRPAAAAASSLGGAPNVNDIFAFI